MKRAATVCALLMCVASVAIASSHMEGNTVVVGGMAMYSAKDIVTNAMESKDHTTLVAAVKAADLVSTLQGKGPFTVFAPTNNAFAALPAGTVDNLLKPANKAMLTKVLTYHVVAGRIDASELMKRIKAGNGKAALKTVGGGTLWAMMNGPMNVIVKDEKGNVANISTYDVMQSNGVIHVVDRVLMPN
ncbi:MAG: fasciclin domain-containing protein [Acidobacteria bacterium]|nr:fasciclin domain-containing protein [Acidobacteriota bacterium]